MPLGLVPKGLMLDFDMSSGDGQPSSLLTRHEDSKVGRLVITAAIRRAERRGTLPKEISSTKGLSEALEKLIYAFPVASEEGGLPSSEQKLPCPEGRLQGAWDSIQDDESVRRLMRELSERYLPLARVELSRPRIFIKYKRLENDVDSITRFLQQRYGPDKRWPFYQRHPRWPLVIRAGHVGRATSEHLRVIAPEGTNFAFALLMPAPDSSKPTSLTYNSRISLERAAMYTSGVPSGDYYFVGALIPSLGGFIRPALWLTGIVALVLGFGAYAEQLWGFLTHLQSSTDAAVTMLLVVPTLFVAYVLREGEHHVRRRLLRPARNRALATLLPLLVAATSLFIDFTWLQDQFHVTKVLAPIWGACSLFAAILFVQLATMGLRVDEATKFVSSQAHETIEGRVAGSGDRDSRPWPVRAWEFVSQWVYERLEFIWAFTGAIAIGAIAVATPTGTQVADWHQTAILIASGVIVAAVAGALAGSFVRASVMVWISLAGIFSIIYFFKIADLRAPTYLSPGSALRFVLAISAAAPQWLIGLLSLAVASVACGFMLEITRRNRWTAWLAGLMAGAATTLVVADAYGGATSASFERPTLLGLAVLAMLVTFRATRDRVYWWARVGLGGGVGIGLTYLALQLLTPR